MIPTASTTAWALHDLALATSFGGGLFGRMALHPAINCIADARERGALLETSWRRFSMLNMVSHGVFAATWLVGRHMLTGREIDRRTRALVTLKDALVATAVISGVASVASGAAAMRDGEGTAAVPRHGQTWEGEPKKAAARASSIAGVINLVALAGIVGVTAVLAMKAGTSGRFSILSRWLP